MEVYAGYGLTGFTGFRLIRLFDGSKGLLVYAVGFS